MKFSIITVVRNGRDTIAECIESVLGQSHENIEYIVIDGGSTDGTTEVIKRYQQKLAAFVSEPDNGIYDAMNKGLRQATGDIIGFLNADDVYAHAHVIEAVAAEFTAKKVDSIFADLVYVDRDKPQRVVRYYRSDLFTINKFAYGWMPAHPTFFVKKEAYDRYGNFKTDYRIAADYELLIRFLYTQRLTYSYLPQILVRMRTGGISTRSFKSNWILNREIVRGCRENGIKTNIFKVLTKYPTKIFQLINKPPLGG